MLAESVAVLGGESSEGGKRRDSLSYAVARAFRADECLRPAFLVALTGYALSDDIRLAMDAGFDRHVAKPPTLEKLHEALAKSAVRPPIR